MSAAGMGGQVRSQRLKEANERSVDPHELHDLVVGDLIRLLVTRLEGEGPPDEVFDRRLDGAHPLDAMNDPGYGDRRQLPPTEDWDNRPQDPPR